MNKQDRARYGIDPYIDWVNAEGMPVIDGGYGIVCSPWKPLVAAVWHQWRGSPSHGPRRFCNMFVFDLPPGGASAPVHHLYEDIYYVLEGHGSTQIELPDGSKRSFEWGPHSMFSIPVNMTYRHFNADGRKRALISTTTNMPLIMNTFHNARFIFDNPFSFVERTGKEGYFSGEGDFIPVRPGNYMWETNFVPDVSKVELHVYADRHRA